MANLANISGTLSYFVSNNSGRLNKIKTRDELVTFLTEGLTQAQEAGHYKKAAVDKILEEVQPLTYKNLYLYVYNLGLAGEGLKTIKVQ